MIRLDRPDGDGDEPFGQIWSPIGPDGLDRDRLAVKRWRRKVQGVIAVSPETPAPPHPGIGGVRARLERPDVR